MIVRIAFLFCTLLIISSCDSGSNSESVASNDSIPHKDSVVFTSLLNESIDMENITDGRVSTEVAASGKASNKLSPESEYGISFSRNIKDIPSYKGIQRITVDVRSFAKKTVKEAVLVVSIDDPAAQKNILWIGNPIKLDPLNTWNNNSFTIELKPEQLDPAYMISIYSWNKTKEEFFVDDLSISISGTTKIEVNQQVSNSNFFYDFENSEDISSPENIKQTIAHSGKQAVDLTGGKEYGPSILKVIKDIASVPFKKVSASIWVYPTSEKPNLVLTASSVNEANNETIFWEGKSTETSVFPLNKWTKMNASFNVPAEKLTPDNKITINIWNKGKTDVIVDDLEIVYGSPNERKGIASAIDINSIYEKRFVPVKNMPPFEIFYLTKSTSNTAVLNEYNSTNEFLSGNFVKTTTNDELLCIKNNIATLFAFNIKKNAFEKISQSSKEEEIYFHSKNKLFAGDYNSDSKTDLLTINTETGEWNILNFENNKWTRSIEGKNKLSKKWINKDAKISSNAVFSESDALVICENKKILTLQLKNNELIEKEITMNASMQQVFMNNDLIYNIETKGNNKELLVFNTGWRFDLKKISMINNDPIIRYMIDFKGYSNDQNPKYYEFTKLVCGYFSSSDQKDILSVSCNCGDPDFNGTTCNTIENLKTLPNTISLYSFEKK